MLKINWILVAHILFWMGYMTAFWGAFEMAYQSPNHPIWSGTFGYPVPHHYIIGFIGIIVGYIALSYKSYIVGINKVREVISK